MDELPCSKQSGLGPGIYEFTPVEEFHHNARPVAGTRILGCPKQAGILDLRNGTGARYGLPAS